MAETHDVSKQVRSYLGVFASLLVLTIVTVGVAQLQLATTERVVVALVVASIKATLVAGIFMHLFSQRSRHISATLVFTATFFLALIILTIVAQGNSFGLG